MRALAAQLNAAGDVEGARAWLMRGITAGDPDAIYQLGQLIDERFGLDEAEPWFRRAAEAGHPIAKRFFRPGGTFYRDPSDPATGNR
jgi:TPR repeat protein